MNWMQGMWRRMNNPRMMIPLLAIGVGVTAIGVAQRRRGGNMWRSMMQPFRRVVRW